MGRIHGAQSGRTAAPGRPASWRLAPARTAGPARSRPARRAPALRPAPPRIRPGKRRGTRRAPHAGGRGLPRPPRPGGTRRRLPRARPAQPEPGPSTASSASENAPSMREQAFADARAVRRSGGPARPPPRRCHRAGLTAPASQSTTLPRPTAATAPYSAPDASLARCRPGGGCADRLLGTRTEAGRATTAHPPKAPDGIAGAGHKGAESSPGGARPDPGAPTPGAGPGDRCRRGGRAAVRDRRLPRGRNEHRRCLRVRRHRLVQGAGTA